MARGIRLNTGMLISIHAPREGSDETCRAYHLNPFTFLSTLPARGATHTGPARAFGSGKFLSTLPARGATLLTAG